MFHKLNYFYTIFLLLFQTFITSHSEKNLDEIGPADGISRRSIDGDCFENAMSESCNAGTPTGEAGEQMTWGHDAGDAGDEMTVVEWDKRGYLTFCLQMGNFGNQVELYLGSIAVAKALDRTLILPQFQHVTFRNKENRIVPFTELFQIEPLLEFHRVVPIELFLKKLAPKYWPPGQRRGYLFRTRDTVECNMAKGSCWKVLDPPVEFDECIPHQLYSSKTDFADEHSMIEVRTNWNKRFPPAEHPVIALSSSGSTFPMLAGNRQLQKYLKWTDEFMGIGRTYIEENFGKDTWVAVHLRNGGDWVKACTPDIKNMHFVMASVQCNERKAGAVTQDMCLPSVSHVLELTLKVFQDVKAKHLFIATDKHPHLEEFKKMLSPLGVSVHHLNPRTPQVDLVILGQSDFFIGTCTSSFTSFVKRKRDAAGKPSIFWGQAYHGF